MKFLLRILIALFVVVAGFFGFGYSLPREHSISCVAVYKQPIQTVWEAISNHASVPEWDKNTASVERMPDKDSHEVWRFTDQGGYFMDIEIRERNAPNHMVSRIVETSLPFGGEWVFDLTQKEGETSLNITENGAIDSAPFRAISRLILGHEMGIKQFLTSLATGKFKQESVEITCTPAT